jgi:hypothetical protein
MFIVYVFLLLIGILGALAVGFSLSMRIENTTIYLLFWMLYLVTLSTFANIIASGYYYYVMKNKRGPQGPRGDRGNPGIRGEVGKCDTDCKDSICSKQILGAIIEQLKQKPEMIDKPIGINNVYIKQKIKQMCGSPEFKKIAPFKGPQKLIEYLIHVWLEWTDLLYDAGSIRYFETIGAETEFEWLSENPFNTMKKYDVFYWGMGDKYRPRLVNNCRPKQIDGKERSMVKLITTNLFTSITDSSGISSHQDASFWRPKSITYQSEIYYPLGDIVIGPTVENDAIRRDRYIGNMSVSSKALGPNRETMLVSGDVIGPFKYNLIWDTSQIGSNKNFWIWRPIGPRTKNGNYIALGDVITTTPYPPPTGAGAPIRCIHESALKTINHNGKIIWTSKGSSDSLLQTNILSFEENTGTDPSQPASYRNGYHLFRATKGDVAMIDSADKNEQFYVVNNDSIDNSNTPGKVSSNRIINARSEGDGYQVVDKKNGKFSLQAFLSLKENGSITHQASGKKFHVSLTNVDSANTYIVSFSDYRVDKRLCVNVIDGYTSNLTCNNSDKNQHFKLEMTGQSKNQCRLKHLISSKYLVYLDEIFAVSTNVPELPSNNNDPSLYVLDF